METVKFDFPVRTTDPADVLEVATKLVPAADPGGIRGVRATQVTIPLVPKKESL